MNLNVKIAKFLRDKLVAVGYKPDPLFTRPHSYGDEGIIDEQFGAWRNRVDARLIVSSEDDKLLLEWSVYSEGNLIADFGRLTNIDLADPKSLDYLSERAIYAWNNTREFYKKKLCKTHFRTIIYSWGQPCDSLKEKNSKAGIT